MPNLDPAPPCAPPNLGGGVIPLGTIVKPWGKVAAVQSTGGERYYFLISRDEDVAYLDAHTVERVYHAQRDPSPARLGEGAP